MAANSNSFIRLRLYFDYPPPAVTDCRMCWLLVDLNRCRVVSDLESIIREKFEFSPRSILDLFIEDCYLPHTERILVVRDNDSVRVKVDSEAQVNGHSSCSDTPSKNCKKRQRPTEEEGPGGDGVSVEWKEKKRKKQSKESLEEVAKLTSCNERNKKSEEKQTKKTKKKKEKKEKAEEPPKPAAPTKKTTTVVEQPVKSIKKASAARAKTQTVSSSETSSSSSEEDVAPKKPPAQKPAPKTPTSTPAASKPPPKTKPTQKLSHPASSSSPETDSSSDESPTVKNTPKNKPLTSTSPKSANNNSNSQQAPSAQRPTNCGKKQATGAAASPDEKAAEPRDSDSEEIELIIRKPLQQPGYGLGRQPSWRGGSVRGARRGGPRERGRGGGRGLIRWQAGGTEFSSNGAKEPSCQTDLLSNTSLVIQNGAESAPKKDYSTMPLLAAPPQMGQKIAFKLLELGENYTPAVSDYKEGKIVSFDPTTKQIELELLHVSQAPVEPGKFDLVYQNPDGSERVEYAVSRGAWVTERWDSLLEPRLLI